MHVFGTTEVSTVCGKGGQLSPNLTQNQDKLGLKVGGGQGPLRWKPLVDSGWWEPPAEALLGLKQHQSVEGLWVPTFPDAKR